MKEKTPDDIYTDMFYYCYDQNSENMTLITDSCISLICQRETFLCINFPEGVTEAFTHANTLSGTCLLPLLPDTNVQLASIKAMLL